MRTAHARFDRPGEFLVALGFHQLVRQIGEGGEPDATASLAGTDRERGRQMCFAGARRVVVHYSSRGGFAGPGERVPALPGVIDTHTIPKPKSIKLRFATPARYPGRASDHGTGGRAMPLRTAPE